MEQTTAVSYKIMTLIIEKQQTNTDKLTKPKMTDGTDRKHAVKSKNAQRDANTARPPQSPIDAQSPRWL